MGGKRRLTKEEFVTKARETHGDKYDYSKFQYESANNKSIIICAIHGEFNQDPRNHFRGCGCPGCKKTTLANLKSKPAEQFISEANLVHENKYDYSKVVYKNNCTKITIICPKHGEFQQTPANHVGKKSCCPKCKTSQGELKVRKILVKLGVKFEEQKRFTGCRNKKPLPFDFYLPEHNCCIEYDGPQHFMPCSFGSSSVYTEELKQNKFKETKYHDLLKNKYCSDNNIKLLRIPYLELNNMLNILSIFKTKE